ncbi:PDZ domain-containing protein [Sorangium sp. So ce117]|uniref:C2 domain-containing protein n=1 Tax=Sorangium sp. So ce117 TaxID=3133277 RepID=UPI003F63CD65
MVLQRHRALSLCLPAFILLLAAGGTPLAAGGCSALYPELSTRLHEPASDQELHPPPPENVRWLRVVRARIPERTRDGRAWDSGAGDLPDPYVRVFVNGAEIFRTAEQANTLEPTWPEGPSGNFEILPEDRLRVEVWEADPLIDKPIGVRDIGRPSDMHRAAGEIDVELDAGGSLTLAFQPAHAKLGLGLWYQLHSGSAFISRTMEGGPAERAGLRKDDEVLEIAGQPVRRMSVAAIRGALDAVPRAGLLLLVKHATGTTERIRVHEGPIYPLFDRFAAE